MSAFTGCRGAFPWSRRARPVPECHAPIAAFDNIPVLSWLILGGRCRHCRARITPRYAVVELSLRAALPALFSACWLLRRRRQGLRPLLPAAGLDLHRRRDSSPARCHDPAWTWHRASFSAFFRWFPVRPTVFSRCTSMGGSTILQLNIQLGLRSLVNSLLGAVVGSGMLCPPSAGFI